MEDYKKARDVSLTVNLYLGWLFFDGWLVVVKCLLVVVGFLMCARIYRKYGRERRGQGLRRLHVCSNLRLIWLLRWCLFLVRWLRLWVRRSGRDSVLCAYVLKWERARKKSYKFIKYTTAGGKQSGNGFFFR
jgi:hypothetical protein